jgi:hypothetical protein
MTVLADIITGIGGLLEGTTVPPRPIPANRFAYVGDDYLWEQDQCRDAPYPAYVEEGEQVIGENEPTDVSGDFRYKTKQIIVRIGYGYSPADDPGDRPRLMADDEFALQRTFEDPLTWATVDEHWSGTEILFTREDVLDDQGVVAILYIVMTLEILFREDHS